MEDKKNFTETDLIAKNNNLKGFLSVFIILIIILSVYYFFWRSISVSLKTTMVEKLSNNEYSSITTGGFPFYKKIEIKDLKINNTTLAIAKNKLTIKKIEVSSFIFSKKFKLSYDGLEIYNGQDKINYKLVYNDDPDISFSIYSDGSLENFSYSDIGYRVIDDNNKTLYTAGNSIFNIQSLRDTGTTDYSVTVDMQNLQNFQVMNSDNKKTITTEPKIYNLKIDLSSSITKEDNEILSSIIKLNNFILNSNKDDVVNISAQILKDRDTPYSYGEINIKLKDYNSLLSEYRDSLKNSINTEDNSKDLDEDSKKVYIGMIDKLYEKINENIKKNPETKENTGVIIIKKEKNVNDYTVNGESIYSIFQSIM